VQLFGLQETQMKFGIVKPLLRIVFGAAIILSFAVLAGRNSSYADQIPAGWEASNMRPIGYSNLDGHGAFKLAIKRVGDKWYLYMGHLWERGWTIVDVTDPTNPKVVKHIPGPDNTFSIQMELHDNLMLTALERMYPSWGGDANKPYDEGLLIWDISNPVNPKLLSHWHTGSFGVHRVGYPGGKYVNVSAAMPGFRGNILVFLDISDPRHPKEVSRWWLKGQKEGEPPIVDVGGGPVPTYPGYHGPAYIAEDCNTDPLNFAAMIDIKDPTHPRLMSMFPLPLPPKDAPYTDFCDKGGRFGPHNTNLEYHLPDVEKQGDLVYLTYFNAGLRIFNIHDPRQPQEVGWFIPPQPTKRIGIMPKTKLVTQTEDVLVDTRGNIYITDKQWGLFVLRYTGKGEPAPTAK
jgi:hypothetical protein